MTTNYRSRSLSGTFGLSPEDDISELFNQAEDDIEDDFTSVLKKLGLAMPSDQAWDGRRKPPVKTVLLRSISAAVSISGSVALVAARTAAMRSRARSMGRTASASFDLRPGLPWSRPLLSRQT